MLFRSGVSKVIWDFSLAPLLVAGYAVLTVMTLLSSEKYVNIAWDSAGVTTGPVTVPLVIALGLGLGQARGAVEGFGILAMASLFPIGAVLVLGLMADWRIRRRRVPATGNESLESPVDLMLKEGKSDDAH